MTSKLAYPKKKLYLCMQNMFSMKNFFRFLAFSALAINLLSSCTTHDRPTTDPRPHHEPKGFLHVEGDAVLDARGDTFYIQGINLGEWLNPEGYMLQFYKANSPRKIHTVLSELVGPDEADAFWREWLKRYIVHDDIRFIASTGANTVRLPFHYKLLTDDSFLGLTSKEDGYAILDECIDWCHQEGLRVILDMHDCPGGQTGDNIDDSYGYPFLFLSEPSQALFCQIWREIADRYADDETVLGYELMNEPIAHYFEAELDTLNNLLLPLYERCIQGIRDVDSKHIILLGAPQWNGNFKAPLVPAERLNKNILYACHRYGHSADDNGIRDFIQFKDSLHVPMCMTETGHRNPEWYREESETLRRNHIGFLFWPYKKMGDSSWTGFHAPDDWAAIRAYADSARTTFRDVREAHPGIERSRLALSALLDSIQFEHCYPDTAYIQALQLK